MSGPEDIVSLLDKNNTNNTNNTTDAPSSPPAADPITTVNPSRPLYLNLTDYRDQDEQQLINALFRNYIPSPLLLPNGLLPPTKKKRYGSSSIFSSSSSTPTSTATSPPPTASTSTTLTTTTTPKSVVVVVEEEEEEEEEQSLHRIHSHSHSLKITPSLLATMSRGWNRSDSRALQRLKDRDALERGWDGRLERAVRLGGSKSSKKRGRRRRRVEGGKNDEEEEEEEEEDIREKKKKTKREREREKQVVMDGKRFEMLVSQFRQQQQQQGHQVEQEVVGRGKCMKGKGEKKENM